MRAILALVPFVFLVHQPAAAAPKVIARGMGPVPGAIVCPDFRALQMGFRSFSARRGPPPEYFGCTQVPPGTVMTVVGADPGGAPVVSVTLPDGRPVRGVTLNGMVEAFTPKPKRTAAVPPRPAPPPPERAAPDEPRAADRSPAADQPPAAPLSKGAGKAEPAGTLPMPALQNSKDTLCGPDKPCTDEEFSTSLGVFQKRWARMPDWLQKACADKSTLPAMDQCIANRTSTWASKHPDKETPWMFPPEMLDQ